MAEEWMSRLQYRGSIALATIVIALLSLRPAGAQVVVPGPARQHGGFLNNLGSWWWYEPINQAKAERHLSRIQEKLRRDVGRGDSSAVDCDVRRIDDLQYRILVDEWLIRKNCGQDPGYYPYPRRLDPITYNAIAQYRVPPRPIGHP
jgi:hypothetical protein